MAGFSKETRAALEAAEAKQGIKKPAPIPENESFNDKLNRRKAAADKFSAPINEKVDAFVSGIIPNIGNIDAKGRALLTGETEEEARQAIDTLDANNPIANTAGEITSLLAGGGLALKGAAKVGLTLPKAVTKTEKARQGILLGSLGSGVAPPIYENRDATLADFAFGAAGGPIGAAASRGSAKLLDRIFKQDAAAKDLREQVPKHLEDIDFEATSSPGVTVNEVLDQTLDASKKSQAKADDLGATRPTPPVGDEIGTTPGASLLDRMMAVAESSHRAPELGRTIKNVERRAENLRQRSKNPGEEFKADLADLVDPKRGGADFKNTRFSVDDVADAAGFRTFLRGIFSPAETEKIFIAATKDRKIFEAVVDAARKSEGRTGSPLGALLGGNQSSSLEELKNDIRNSMRGVN